MVRRMALLLGAAVSVGGCTSSGNDSPGHASSSPAASSPPAVVSIHVSAGAAPNIVVGLPRHLHVIVRNRSNERRGDLLIASSDTIGGSPGSAVEQWIPALHGRCYGAAATTYCPLPSIPARSSYRARTAVTVPLRLAGISTVGKTFVQTVFIVTRSGGAPLSPVRHVRLNIIGKSSSLTAHGCHSHRGTPMCTIKADGPGPPARPCAVARAGQRLVFRIDPDVPQPACWRTATFSAVRIVNATGHFGQTPKVVSGHMRGLGRYSLQPGDATVLDVPSGNFFAPGTHCLTASVFPGSCLDVWVDPSAA